MHVIVKEGDLGQSVVENQSKLARIEGPVPELDQPTSRIMIEPIYMTNRFALDDLETSAYELPFEFNPAKSILVPEIRRRIRVPVAIHNVAWDRRVPIWISSK